MSGHTPGPWRLIPRDRERWPCVVRQGEGGFTVQGLSPEREDADARLIAAAPELLAALAEMTELAAGPVGGVTVDAKRAILAKARVAIAKATAA